MKIYLDVCCLSRPFDDQEQARIRLECEAVLLVIDKMKAEKWAVFNSDAIKTELENIPDESKEKQLRDFLKEIESEYVCYNQNAFDRAQELSGIGFGNMDALHIACAEEAKVDIFLSTDDKLVKIAKKNKVKIKIKIENPVNWLREQGEKNENA